MAKANGHFPTSFPKYSRDDLKKLGITIELKNLFPNVTPVQPEAFLTDLLSDLDELRLDSEKSKSENIISLIIRDLLRKNKGKIALFSGYSFEVAPEKGLTGTCDFLLTKNVQSEEPDAPVFFIVEAKGENLTAGIPQCLAEMYAAQCLNEQAGKPLKEVFGAVTFGREWLFLQLQGNIAYRDRKIYPLSDLPRLLGVLQTIVNLT